MSKLIYQDIHTNEFSDSEIWEAIRSNDVESLTLIPLKLAFCHDNWRFVQDIGVQLSDHDNENVRGNAVRSFAYTAMNHGRVEKRVVKPVLLRALKDNSDWVKACAQETIDDVNRFMGWRIGTAKETKAKEKRYAARRGQGN
ncbi:hypothetical protein [Microbulbifer aggregans]|uniref:hypothetical protein n=1 Tax=Microbulbifer aggregans TaxID=1769779 RepID=UPI001CFDBCA6|nr:hypothetical protein [Microbulbifer aggregans]